MAEDNRKIMTCPRCGEKTRNLPNHMRRFCLETPVFTEPRRGLK